MRMIAATNNKGKLAELSAIVQKMGHQIVSLSEQGVVLNVEETGATFAENALLKAEAICKKTNLPTIGDDSGLVVDALGGAPGVYSARYAGPNATDDENIDLLLKNMKDVAAKQRTAHFVCTLAYAVPGKKTVVFSGTCEGTIAFARRGTGGFGYDPIFLVGGKSYAEILPEQKNTISHRAKALEQLAQYLKAQA